MPARAGFKDVTELRSNAEAAAKAAQVADRTLRDAIYGVESQRKALPLLAVVPPDIAADTVLLKAHVDGLVAAERVKERAARTDLQGLTALQKGLLDKDFDGPALAAALQASIATGQASLPGLTADAQEKKSKSEELAARYKAYVDLAEVKGATLAAQEQEVKNFYKAFEKDRTATAPRVIEQELAELKKKLAEFADKPVAAAAPCQLTALKEFVDKLESEVDQIAHMAPCHKCQKENSVPRSDLAKNAIKAKLVALEALAQSTDGGPSPSAQADFALAKALENLRTTTDEDGKTAGKMLGVVLCETGDGRIVSLYGYSGTIGSSSRAAESQVSALRRKIAIPDQMADKQAEIDAKVAELKRYDTDIGLATAAAMGTLRGSPEQQRLNALKGARAKAATEHAALGGAYAALAQACPDADALATLHTQLTAVQAQLPVASARDTAAEAATGAGWVQALPADGELRSAGGDTTSLAALNAGHTGTPHGVCAAPKMIQAARRLGYKVIAMAEAWYGGGDANTHGELVASCATCMKNIGFQLCENPHG